MNLPIWRDISRLLVLIEEAVRKFPRYHKYTLGSDLRRQAMNVHRLLVRALNAQGPERPRQVERLNLAVDDLKLMIQLGKEIQAFQSFRQFEEIAELAVQVGRQSGLWRKRPPSPPAPLPQGEGGSAWSGYPGTFPGPSPTGRGEPFPLPAGEG